MFSFPGNFDCKHVDDHLLLALKEGTIRGEQQFRGEGRVSATDLNLSWCPFSVCALTTVRWL